MSTVEQIHLLETRVDRLLGSLRELRSDNDSLRGDLAASEERAAELERRLAASETAHREADSRGDELQQRLSHLHAEHEEIEATITRTLDQLGKLEIGAAGDADGDAAVATAGDAASDAEAVVEADGDAPVAETALLDDDAPAAADQPEADGDHREGDDLDIF